MIVRGVRNISLKENIKGALEKEWPLSERGTSFRKTTPSRREMGRKYGEMKGEEVKTKTGIYQAS